MGSRNIGSSTDAYSSPLSGILSSDVTRLHRYQIIAREGIPVKRSRNLAALSVLGAGLLLVSTTPAGAAPATKAMSFSGKYSGTASLLINGSAITIQSVKGTGTSTVGKGSVSATGSGTSTSGVACVPFTGKGSIKGAKGTIKFAVKSKSQGCGNSETPPVTVTVSGVAQVSGGTGTASGAHGTLKFSGTLTLNGTSGAQSGAFSGKLSGKLTVK